MIVSMSKTTNHETNEQTERKAAFSSATKDAGVCFQTAQKQGGLNVHKYDENTAPFPVFTM